MTTLFICLFVFIQCTGSTTEIICSNAGSRLSPSTGVVDCDVTRNNLPNWNILSGETLVLLLLILLFTFNSNLKGG